MFNGTQPALLHGNDTFDLTFHITPFRYDPSRGNLLLNVVINNPTLANGFVAFATNGSHQTDRIFQSFGAGPVFARGPGLYTRFGVAPVPESSTAADFGVLLCLGGLVIAVRRHRLSR